MLRWASGAGLSPMTSPVQRTIGRGNRIQTEMKLVSWGSINNAFQSKAQTSLLSLETWQDFSLKFGYFLELSSMLLLAAKGTKAPPPHFVVHSQLLQNVEKVQGQTVYFSFKRANICVCFLFPFSSIKKYFWKGHTSFFWTGESFQHLNHFKGFRGTVPFTLKIIKSYIICTGRTNSFKKKTFHRFFFFPVNLLEIIKHVQLVLVGSSVDCCIF